MHLNRSLGRGLKLLALLNSGGEHRVASLARAVKLPRSTAFRILCTLVEEGYVWRDPATDIYHPTALVRALSDGFDGTARLVQAAQPLVTALGKELIWPVNLGTLSGTSVLLRQTTDAMSPLAAVRYSAGYRAPLLDRAAGLVLLAFSDRPQSQMLLDLLYRRDAPERPHLDRADVERLIADVRSVGFSCMQHPSESSERSSLSVPVLAGGDTLAALSVRFARSAVTRQVIMERFLPALRRAAHAMVDCFNRSSPAPSPLESPAPSPPGSSPESPPPSHHAVLASTER
jgi:IclR family mhp operon transcriptional activator